jgi:hypothetical protein
MKIENPLQTPSLIRTSKLQTPKEMFEANNTEKKGVMDKAHSVDEKKGKKIDKYS